MSIGIRHLRAFVAVAREESFTRAADKIALSQPALTATVQQLEKELGLALLDRTTRRVVLTAEGQEFLLAAEKLLQQFRVVISDVRDVANRRRGRVRIAAVASIATRVLPSAVRYMTENFPGISIHLRDANASEIIEKVRRNEVDFGVGTTMTHDPEIVALPLIKDRFGVVFNAKHPLATSSGALSWEDLTGYSCIGFGEDTAIRRHLDSLPDLPDSVAVPSIVSSNIISIEALLEDNLGVAVMTELSAPPGRNTRLLFRPLVEPFLEREISLLTLRDRTLSPAAEAMRKLLISTLAEMPQLSRHLVSALPAEDR